MSEDTDINLARGAVAIVDKAVFRAALDLMQSHNLLDRFDEFLEEQGHYQIILDVNYANHLKRFLAKNLPREPIAKMIVASACGGSPGMRESPTGLRG